MFTEDKITEIFCIADDFCNFFDAQMKKYTFKSDKKRQYHREGRMSKAEVMMIMILFHSSGYRCTRRSRASPREASAQWDGSSDSSCT